MTLVILNSCATSEQARDVQPSGFLTDYSKLRSGGDDEPLLFYRNPSANFRHYDMALIDQVEIWRGKGSSLDDIPAKRIPNVPIAPIEMT